MRYSVFAASVLLMAASPAALAVYKCKGPGGAAIYQDQPCEASGERISVQPNGPEVDRAARAAAVEAAARQRKPVSELDPATIKVDQQAILFGMTGGEPVVGMNLTQLDMALGKPTRIDSEIKDGYHAQIYIYRKQRDKIYDVYVREGIVVKILSRRTGGGNR